MSGNNTKLAVRTTETPAKQVFSLTPSTLDEAMRFSEIIAKSDLAPKDYRNKPGNVLLAVEMGSRLGIGPVQAMQNISIINGRASLWGDAALAVCKAHPQFVDVIESFDERKLEATCIAKRAGSADVKHTFSFEDAKTAKLWGKQGPWVTYPKRMAQMRARGFALRDQFPDALLGMITAEEASDYPQARSANTGEPVELPADWIDAAEQDRLSCEGVIAAIDAATTVDELAATRSDGQHLRGEDRRRALEAGQRRYAELMAQAEKPSEALTALLGRIEAATTLRELQDTWPATQKLNAAERERAVEAGKRRAAALAEAPPPADKPLPVDLARRAITAAKTPAEFAKATDLAHALPADERETIMDLWRSKQRELDAATTATPLDTEDSGPAWEAARQAAAEARMAAEVEGE